MHTRSRKDAMTDLPGGLADPVIEVNQAFLFIYDGSDTMKMKAIAILSLLTAVLFAIPLQAQSFSQLEANYSGDVTWDDATKTVTFTSTGTINFTDKMGNGTDPRNDQKQHYWDVPVVVDHIVIEANVTVTGAFHVYATTTIRGVNRKTSIIYGTPLQRWADANNPGGQDLDEWYYAQIDNQSGTLTVQNLTMLNPFSYFIRGYGGNRVCHIQSLDLIDDRGGWGNHSDGFAGADGSTIDDCYLETGDDAIKAYFDITVTNTTIKMVQNCVPVQIGWHTHGTVDARFQNLTIIGDRGRGEYKGIVASHGSAGNTKLNLYIDGCNFQNPNASLFDLQNQGDVVSGYIRNANISVARYAGSLAGSTPITICGSTHQTNVYDCRNSDATPYAPRNLVAFALSGTQIELTWDDFAFNESDFQIQRSLTGDDGWEELAVVDSNTTTFSDTALDPETQYFYRICARNTHGSSEWSDVVEAVTEKTGGDDIPWVEDFISLTDNTGWRVIPGGGTFKASGGDFLISNTGDERVLVSETINIGPAESVNISGWMRSEGDMETDQDFVKLLYRVDGGDEIPVASFQGKINHNNPTGQEVMATEVSGNTLHLIIRGYTSYDDEIYHVDNVSVVDAGGTAAGDLPILPSEYNLEQNYPNPFNPKTQIGYTLMADARVTLDIFNLLGEKVKTLVDARQPAGQYRVIWQAMNDQGLHVPNGLYFYKMTASSERRAWSDIRKMLLVK